MKGNLIWLILLLNLALSVACVIGRPAATAIPAGRPADFEVQTATPTLDPDLVTPEPLEPEAEAVVIAPLADAPTHTPDPNLVRPTSLPLPSPTASPLPLGSTGDLTPTVELTQTNEITATVTPLATARPVVEPDPPLQGGDWDFEDAFIPWPNPYGEPCPGASVASGWTAFVEEGQYGSSCMNENLYAPNVFSGFKSQEMTFDFIAANSGIYRTIPTKVGHRYNIVAHAKHDRSLSPVQMFLGVDLSGDTAWFAETVEWFPWDGGAEDTWIATEETVTATGEQLTIFIRGLHPLAEQGGKTVIDNVSVTDLGP